MQVHFAVIAGLFAAFGSLFGKLAGSSDEVQNIVINFQSLLPSFFGKIDDLHTDPVCLRSLQIIFFILMLFCNASVWTFYVKALQSSESSLPATVVSTATNYVSSAVLGRLIFKEATGLLWWCGSGLVVCGLALITHANTAPSKSKSE